VIQATGSEKPAKEIYTAVLWLGSNFHHNKCKFYATQLRSMTSHSAQYEQTNVTSGQYNSPAACNSDKIQHTLHKKAVHHGIQPTFLAKSLLPRSQCMCSRNCRTSSRRPRWVLSRLGLSRVYTHATANNILLVHVKYANLYLWNMWSSLLSSSCTMC